MDLDDFLCTYMKFLYRFKYKELILSGKATPDYNAESGDDFTDSYLYNAFDIDHFNKKAKSDGIVPSNASICKIETIHLSDKKIDFRKEFPFEF